MPSSSIAPLIRDDAGDRVGQRRLTVAFDAGDADDLAAANLEGGISNGERVFAAAHAAQRERRFGDGFEPRRQRR